MAREQNRKRCWDVSDSMLQLGHLSDIARPRYERLAAVANPLWNNFQRKIFHFINTDYETSDLNAKCRNSLGQTNSVSTSIGVPSFSLPCESHSHLDKDLNSRDVSRIKEVGDEAHSITFFVDNLAENGVAPSQLMSNDSIARGSMSVASGSHLDEDLENMRYNYKKRQSKRECMIFHGTRASFFQFWKNYWILLAFGP